MSSYPKWLYHPTKEPALVADDAARIALGAGWAESPADIHTAPPKAETTKTQHAETTPAETPKAKAKAK